MIRATFSILLLLFAACSRDRESAQDSVPRSASLPYTATPSEPPYRVTDVSGSGRIVGAVVAGATIARDTLVRITTDTTVCGTMVRERAIQRRGAGVGAVVIWLANARAGKALPLERRYEISHEQCRLEPRVQAAIVGGTLNVRSSDPIVHQTLFLPAGVETVLETVSLHGEGQVVPLEKILARPLRLVVRCDLHPSTKGWIHVFDHPYFAVTRPDGRFALDSVPAGQYTLITWHERFGSKEHQVTVQEGRDVAIRVDYGGK